MRLLIAASGTGGHLFPALAVAEELESDSIQWLGVRDRLDRELVPTIYPMHTVNIEGFQSKFSFNNILILPRLVQAIFQVKHLLVSQKIDLVFTTGGYIAAPAIIAARWAGIPVVLHESNYLPGKVTRLCGRWCSLIALGFPQTSKYLSQYRTMWTGNLVRRQFLQPQPMNLPIPPDVPVILVMGGSQGAVSINHLVREAAPAWFNFGAYLVHLTGVNDPDRDSLRHPQYFPLPFYPNMASLLQRATLAISRAGSGSLTELAITGTPSLLIPYPYAAEDHQSYNARVFVAEGAAYLLLQSQLTTKSLQQQVLQLLHSPEQLKTMSLRAASLGTQDSAKTLANLLKSLAA